MAGFSARTNRAFQHFSGEAGCRQQGHPGTRHIIRCRSLGLRTGHVQGTSKLPCLLSSDRVVTVRRCYQGTFLTIPSLVPNARTNATITAHASGDNRELLCSASRTTGLRRWPGQFAKLDGEVWTS